MEQTIAFLVWMGAMTVISIDTHWRVRRLEKRFVDVARIADYVKFQQMGRSGRRKEWI